MYTQYSNKIEPYSINIKKKVIVKYENNQSINSRFFILFLPTKFHQQYPTFLVYYLAQDIDQLDFWVIGYFFFFFYWKLV